MRTTLFVILLSTVLLSTVALADVPGQINYQGTLTDAGVLGHRDLYVIDVVTIPQGFDNGVGEAEDEQVLYRLLSHVVIDSVDLLLAVMPG